jgi:LysR family glycine cleavage system transcriptional activator
MQIAISQRIRTLEEFLGDRLFTRENISIQLTKTGREYLRSTRNVITEILVATDRVIGRHCGDELTIDCLGTFAIKCLIPLLPS